MRTAPVGLVVAAWLALPAWGAAQNVVVNGEFDGNITSWKIVRGEGVEVWDPVDYQGNPASGSLHLTNTGTEANAVTVSGQCIEITPTGTYEFGTNIFFSPQAAGGLASVVVGWFGNPCCTGTPIAGASSPPVSSTTTGVWVETFTPAESAPPGTVAVGVGVGLLSLGTAAPSASAAASFTAGNVRWPGGAACPETGGASAAPRNARPASRAGTGASLEALFDHVRFGPTGTTPAQLQSFAVE